MNKIICSFRAKRWCMWSTSSRDNVTMPRDRMTSIRMSTIWISGIRLSSTRLVSVLSRYLPRFTFAKDSNDGVADPSRQTACASLAR